LVVHDDLKKFIESLPAVPAPDMKRPASRVGAARVPAQIAASTPDKEKLP
jgi:hypothetical protein